MIPDSIRQHDWNDLDWRYIQGLSKAVEAVRKEYIYENEERCHLERVFAYELYYCWKMILAEESENPENLLLNGELSKHYYIKKKYGFPDMVLHGDYTNRDKQFIICEIKSSRNKITKKYLKKDIRSLIYGIYELDYKCATFIYFGNANKWKSMIKRLREELNKELPKEWREKCKKKIIFIGVDGKTSHYELL